MNRWTRSVLIIACFSCCLSVAGQSRWRLNDSGGITWKIEPGEAHSDHIEMSGRKVSVVVTYGVDRSAKLNLNRLLVFPTLRSFPNETHDHLSLLFGDDNPPRIMINRRVALTDQVQSIRHDGIMRVETLMGRRKEILLTRTLFPSVDEPVVVEKLTFTNQSEKDATIELDDTERIIRTQPTRGVYGGYVGFSKVLGAGERLLRPGESATFTLIFGARKPSDKAIEINPDSEERARQERVASFRSKLRLETPDSVINTACDFAKIRAAESIYDTKAGVLLAPGGVDYYAAVWANDNGEYANPFLGYFGDDLGTQAAINSFRLFSRFMNSEYKPIPSSIISEGDGIWHGRGDRGDMAMLAYGAGRFALANGRKETAEQLWPLIAWCLEYCRRKVNAQGVVASDTDELENRFPSGKANLNTSSLYYDALNSAVMLGRELRKPKSLLEQYSIQARDIRIAIERYFGANVEGFDTYRYYDKKDLVGDQKYASYADKPDALRAWIATPLTVDIFDRKVGTIDALFSERLWTNDGLASEAGDIRFWDRATLYGLRGAFAAGATERAFEKLAYYSRRRLLGDHVPYPVEAYPEGNQRHLAAESSLYVRVITEGLFGIRPTGFTSFRCSPRLPKAWDKMRLKNIHGFGSTFDLVVSRTGERLKVDVYKSGILFSSSLVKDDPQVSLDIKL